MLNGRVVVEGGPELALTLEDKGYDWVRAEFAPEEPPVAEEAEPVAAASS